MIDSSKENTYPGQQEAKKRYISNDHILKNILR